MPFAGNFHPEWGYLAPAPSFVRSVRMVLVATAVGATAGTGAVFALMDRAPVEDTQQALSLTPAVASQAKPAAAAPDNSAEPAGAQPQLETSAAAAAWAELNTALTTAAAATNVEPSATPPQPTVSRPEPAAGSVAAEAAPVVEKKKPAKKKYKVVRRRPPPDEPYGRDSYSYGDWRESQHAGGYYSIR